LPAEHHELMPQYEQFDVFGEFAAPPSGKHGQQSREPEIGKGGEHPPMLPEPTSGTAESANLGFETLTLRERLSRPGSSQRLRAGRGTAVSFGAIDKLVAGEADTSHDFGHPLYPREPTTQCSGFAATETSWGRCPIEGMRVRVPNAARPTGG
jgi:hypothetical protein